MKKSLIAIIAIVAIAIILSSTFLYLNYGAPNSQSQGNAVTVVDDEGTAVNFSSTPQRIVSMAPSNTQILFAVGVGNKVVGVTEFDHIPYNFTNWFAAGNMTNIGGYSTPN